MKIKNYKMLNSSNPKTSKGVKFGYLSGVLYLAPHKLVGNAFKADPKAFQVALRARYDCEQSIEALEAILPKVNACTDAIHCIAPCLNTAGHGQYSTTQFWRAIKTAFFIMEPIRFSECLKREVVSFEKRANKFGLKLSIRTNGTSDFSHSMFGLDQKEFPEVTFYNYTKHEGIHVLDPSLTFSIQQESDMSKLKSLEHHNFAIVTRQGLKDPILSHPMFEGYQLIDGDEHDLRFLDKKGSIAVLLAKGKARKDTKSQLIANNWKTFKA